MPYTNKIDIKFLLILYYIFIFCGAYELASSIFPKLNNLIEWSSNFQMMIYAIVVPTCILVILSVKYYLFLKIKVAMEDKTLRDLKVMPAVLGAGLILMYWTVLRGHSVGVGLLTHLVALFTALFIGYRITDKYNSNYSDRIISSLFITFSLAVMHFLISLFILIILYFTFYDYKINGALESVRDFRIVFIRDYLGFIFTGSILAPILSLLRFQKKRYADDSLIDGSSFE